MITGWCAHMLDLCVHMNAQVIEMNKQLFRSQNSVTIWYNSPEESVGKYKQYCLCEYAGIATEITNLCRLSRNEP